MTSKELYKNETGKDAFTFQFNENMEQLSVSHTNINILHAKNGRAQKLGLLNHRILPENEGILFFKKRWVKAKFF